MREDLIALFRGGTELFTGYILRDPNPSKKTLDDLQDYVERHQFMLREAKHFVIDEDAYDMLRKLLLEIQKDGLDDTFRNARFPFPYILIEGGQGLAATVCCLIVQDDGKVYSECFIKSDFGISPNAAVLVWKGANAEPFLSPVGEAINKTAPEQVDQEIKYNTELCGLLIALCTLLNYKDMLELDERPLYPRPERRRAQRLGKELPEQRKVVVRLGSLGRIQAAAMGGASQITDHKGKRAHWVRGHFMRNRSGGLSWRMPHVRGLGTPTDQTRLFNG